MAGVYGNIWKMYLYKFLVSFLLVNGVWVPYYLDYGGFSFFQVMVLESAFMFSSMVLTIPAGAVADVLGRKKALGLSLVFFILSVGAYSMAPSFSLFIAANVLWAIGFSLEQNAEVAMVYDSVRSSGKSVSSKSAISKLRSFEYAGFMISAPLGSMLAERLGLRAVMLFTAIPLVLCLIVPFLLKEPPKKRKQGISYVGQVKEGLKYFKNHTILKILALDRVVLDALFFLMFWIYPVMLMGRGLPLAYLGYISTGIVASRLLLLNSFPRLEKLFSKKGYLLFSALIAGVSYLFLGITSSLWVSVILLLVLCGFGLTRYVLFDHYVNRFIPTGIRATVLGSINMFEFFLLGITFPFIGKLVELNLEITLIIIGIACIGFSLISRVKEEHLID